MSGFAGREEEMPWLEATKRLSTPVERQDDLPSVGIEWDRPLSGFSLAPPYRQSPSYHVNIAPAQPFDLASAHRSVQRKPRCQCHGFPFRPRRGTLQQFSLLFISECAPDLLADRQGTNFFREEVPAFRPLEHTAEDVQFPVQSCIGAAGGQLLDEVGPWAGSGQSH
jgi:hypothetical protein